MSAALGGLLRAEVKPRFLRSYHPGLEEVEGESPKSASMRLSFCAYRKAASKRAQTPSLKFTTIPFSALLTLMISIISLDGDLFCGGCQFKTVVVIVGQ